MHRLKAQRSLNVLVVQVRRAVVPVKANGRMTARKHAGSQFGHKGGIVVNNSHLMRDYIRDDYGLRRLQSKLLEIAFYIDSLCRRFGIDYCVMGGTALGAKRHGGFIPWDDDLDILMTPDNYEKFRDIFYRYGDREKYYLQEIGYTDGMVTTPKLRMNGTTYIEEIVKDWDMHHGIYVDIFILHNCPDNVFLQVYQYLWSMYLVLKGLSNRGYDRRRGVVTLILKLMKLLPERFLVKRALREIYRYRGRKTSFFCNFLGQPSLRRGIYRREWFEPLVDVCFENVKLKAPNKLHEFLVQCFGDYMKLPSPEDIKRDQHAWRWDVDRDFRDYLPDVASFADERHLL